MLHKLTSADKFLKVLLSDEFQWLELKKETFYRTFKENSKSFQGVSVVTVGIFFTITVFMQMQAKVVVNFMN